MPQLCCVLVREDDGRVLSAGTLSKTPHRHANREMCILLQCVFNNRVALCPFCARRRRRRPVTADEGASTCKRRASRVLIHKVIECVGERLPDFSVGTQTRVS